MLRLSGFRYFLWMLPFVLASCKEPYANEPVPRLPQATTDAAICVSATSLLLSGKITPNDYATKYCFEYGFTSSYGNQTPIKEIGAGTAQVIVQDTISIAPDSIYHFRIVAHYSSSNIFGSDKALDLKQYPLVSIPASINGVLFPIDYLTYFSVAGMVRPRGLQTRAFFEYGLTADYGYKTARIDIDPLQDSVFVGADFQNLGQGTYHWRLSAINAVGTAVTSDSSFVFVPGFLTADQPTNITSNSATLNGHINTGGRLAVYYFIYGTTIFYGSSSLQQEINSGTKPVAISAKVNNLIRGSQYHWRLVCRFPTAQLSSGDSVFTTLTTAANAQEFFFPEIAGTQLTYQYSYANAYGPLGYRSDINGIHTWSVKSTINDGTTTTIAVEDIQLDSVHTRGNYVPDTTYLSQDTVQFSVVRTSDSFMFNFSARFLPSKYKSIPRFLDGTDTLTINPTIDDTPLQGYCRYISRFGLSGFSMSQSSNNYYFERMSLISMQEP